MFGNAFHDVIFVFVIVVFNHVNLSIESLDFIGYENQAVLWCTSRQTNKNYVR